MKAEVLAVSMPGLALARGASGAPPPPCDGGAVSELPGVWRLVEASTARPDGSVRHPLGQSAADLHRHAERLH